MVKSVVKHIFDRYFLFSKPPEIRTVEGLSAVVVVIQCEHRLCSQTSRATNCATPRYAIKLWSCKWSNMWSGTNLTAFLIFTNCPKSAPLKGFRRFFFSGTEWEIYAPKCRALPTAPHLGRAGYRQNRYPVLYIKNACLSRFFGVVFRYS